MRRAPNSSGLYDVLDLILDKGIVIDAFVRVSLVGIELLTVDLRVVIASVDTYLRYAEGVERLQVYDRAGSKRLGDMVGGAGKTMALKKGAESIGRAIGGKKNDADDEGDEDESGNGSQSGGLTGTLTRGVRNVVGRIIGGNDEGDSDDRAKDEDRGQRRQHRPVPERRDGERRPAPAGNKARR